jgi:hypothetical protein
MGAAIFYLFAHSLSRKRSGLCAQVKAMRITIQNQPRSELKDF